MQPQAVIRYSVSIVVRLIDAVGGKELDGRGISFDTPKGIGSPLSKGHGFFLFLNLEREDFSFEVRVQGYEPTKVDVRFDELDERAPEVEVYLIPMDYPITPKEYLRLEGTLEGITSIEAVSLSDAALNVKEYDEKKRIMTLFNPHGVDISSVRYGLLNDTEMVFDRLMVEEDISRQQVKLKSKPEHGWSVNQPITRIIHGQIKENGKYLLKVSDNARADYLVRYVVDEKVYFQKMDFHQPEELSTKGE